MTDLTDLQTIRSNLITAYKTASASPKASYSVDGQQVDHPTYLEKLEARIKGITDLLAQEDGSQYAPFEEIQRGAT